MVLTGDEMQQIIGFIILASMIYGAIKTARQEKQMFGHASIHDYVIGALMGFVASVMMVIMLSLVAALCLGAL